MRTTTDVALTIGRVVGRGRTARATLIMAVLILGLGFFLIYPLFILFLNSFNVARDILVGPFEWGLASWRSAFVQPGLLKSIANTVVVFGIVLGITFPTATLIAWTLARVRIPFSHGLEFMFWIAFMIPGISVTVSWVLLADPRVGILNALLTKLPFIESNPFNIFSLPGIIWVHLMASSVAPMVMLLTPAFRNMNAALEEAARVAGATNLKTMIRITLPVMVPPMALVFALQLVHLFRTFEIEQILGTRFGFYVFSTMVFNLVRNSDPPQYSLATALASVTLVVIAFIIPIQRWLIYRRRYTTITSGFKPGLVDLGKFRYAAFGAIVLLLVFLIAVPAITLLVGSFMTRAGYFQLDPLFSLRHWAFVLGEDTFLRAMRNTFLLSMTTAIVSPVLFSLVAYVLVRTNWRGRGVLDSIIWVSAVVPGILAGLGLLLMFLGIPALRVLYGTIWALVIVIVLQGNTTGVQLAKGIFTQIGAEMEEAARIAGAGWVRTYFRIWIPLLMPTLVLLAMLNFTIAANTTSSIILLANRDTMTLSILALAYTGQTGFYEEAGIVSLFIIMMTVGVALVARAWGLRLGVQHQ